MCSTDRNKKRMASKSDESSISLGSGGLVTASGCCLLEMLRTTRTWFFFVISGPRRAGKGKANNGERDGKIKCGSVKGRTL